MVNLIAGWSNLHIKAAHGFNQMFAHSFFRHALIPFLLINKAVSIRPGA